MTSKTRTRRAYTEEFKREAVALITEQGYKIAQAARSLDIGANLLDAGNTNLRHRLLVSAWVLMSGKS